MEPGENALVLHSGYFGDSFQDCLETYGANVDQIKAPIGAAVAQAEIEKALQSKKYKILTFTHVDTSTGAFFVHSPILRCAYRAFRCLIRRESDRRDGQARVA